MSYWVCSCHGAWATRERRPTLCPEEFGHVETVVRAASVDERVVAHAVGCLTDYVHVVASIPPALSVAAVAKRRKGSTSHVLGERRRAAGRQEAFA